MLSATLVAKIKVSLMRDEGLNLHPYMDTMGHTTIGYGRNLDSTGISLPEAEYLLSNDIEFHYMFLVKHYPWFEKLDENRQAALVNMSYNLGTKGISAFKNMLSCLSLGNYLCAGDDAMMSTWAKQVPNRALQIAHTLRTGEPLELN